MIRYALKCAEGHSFDSWFKSAEAYDDLADRGLVSCAVCGGTEVSKAIMAPRVATKDENLTTPASPAEQALQELRKKVEENADYVGKDFVTEARAIHEGDAPDRPIWGEAKIKDAKALAEDGVPVAPLPFAPTRKTN